MRYRLRACEQALNLVELLQQAIDAGYFLPNIRQEAQRVACRLVILALGCSSRPLSRPRPGRGASLAATRDCQQASPLPPRAARSLPDTSPRLAHPGRNRAALAPGGAAPASCWDDRSISE